MLAHVTQFNSADLEQAKWREKMKRGVSEEDSSTRSIHFQKFDQAYCLIVKRLLKKPYFQGKILYEANLKGKELSWIGSFDQLLLKLQRVPVSS